ncbi:ABC transporter permease [Ensifer sp. Root31]|uniref:ABC transporter permease n=1 Tax=Ensifer sp. Root31 TaxID=1736512 RepID=UPI001FCD5BA7|nr:ABC transporter permease [Ensifer sp. Root31]
MGTDALGRDIWSRIAYGARVSLLVGTAVAFVAIVLGTAFGSLAGYFKLLDIVLMRIMDGLMAIPGILLAIAFVSLAGPSLLTVTVALVITEVPKVARLVRASVLGLREEPFVEAAIGLGTRTPRILWHHVLPNVVPLLIVQGTYIFASAILTEATLSFLGAGFSADTPTWGNVMASGREVFQRAPWIVFFPGILLASTVLSVNLLGDGLRDALDPKLKIER